MSAKISGGPMAATRGRFVMAAEKKRYNFKQWAFVFLGENRIPQHHTHTIKLIGKGVVVLRLWSVGTCGHQKVSCGARNGEAEGARNVPARTGVVAPWWSQLLGAWLGADHWGLS